MGPKPLLVRHRRQQTRRVAGTMTRDMGIHSHIWYVSALTSLLSHSYHLVGHEGERPDLRLPRKDGHEYAHARSLEHEYEHDYVHIHASHPGATAMTRQRGRDEEDTTARAARVAERSASWQLGGKRAFP